MVVFDQHVCRPWKSWNRETASPVMSGNDEQASEMSKTEKLYELYKKDRDYVLKNKVEVARQIPMDYSTLCKAVKKWEKGIKPSKSVRPENLGGTLDDFKKKYDDDLIVPRKIREGIERYLRTPDGQPKYLHDQHFRQLCGVSTTKWRRYADDFKHLQVNRNGIIWGHPEIIEQMREVLLR